MNTTLATLLSHQPYQNKVGGFLFSFHKIRLFLYLLSCTETSFYKTRSPNSITQHQTISFNFQPAMGDDIKASLVQHLGTNKQQCQNLGERVFLESKKLWRVVGPAILSRISTFSSIVITQACDGHLGDLELASLAMAVTVLANFTSGVLVCDIYRVNIDHMRFRLVAFK